jgi:hypothetical protein
MHAGFHCVVSNGSFHGLGGAGGLNRSGGDCANGMPRNWLTAAVAVGTDTTVPTMTPASIVAVGFHANAARNKGDATKREKTFGIAESRVLDKKLG